MQTTLGARARQGYLLAAASAMPMRGVRSWAQRAGDRPLDGPAAEARSRSIDERSPLMSTTRPRSIVDAQLPTNPVYVPDLGILIPFHAPTANSAASKVGEFSTLGVRESGQRIESCPPHQ
jgi:hypothetical protein